jgi:hypothetical protein
MKRDKRSGVRDWRVCGLAGVVVVWLALVVVESSPTGELFWREKKKKKGKIIMSIYLRVQLFSDESIKWYYSSTHSPVPTGIAVC